MPKMEEVSAYKHFLKKKNQAQIQAEHYSILLWSLFEHIH